MSTFGIFFYEPFRGQGELLIIETFRPEVLTLGILTVGQTYIQEECEIYKASIVLGKLGKGYIIIRGILVGGDIRNSRLGLQNFFLPIYLFGHLLRYTYVFNTFYCLLFYLKKRGQFFKNPKNLKKYVRWYGIIIMHYISEKSFSCKNFSKSSFSDLASEMLLSKISISDFSSFILRSCFRISSSCSSFFF